MSLQGISSLRARQLHPRESPEVQLSQCCPAARQQPRHRHHSLRLCQTLPAQHHRRLATGEEPANTVKPVEGGDGRDRLQPIHDLMPIGCAKAILPAAPSLRLLQFISAQHIHTAETQYQYILLHIMLTTISATSICQMCYMYCTST